MKNKKAMIITLVILLIVLIAGGVFAYIYLKTDLLKTDKQLFYQYLAKSMETDTWSSELYQQYELKKQSTPYQNNGEISYMLSNATTDSEQNMLANYTITFNGKNDNKNAKNNQQIVVNYQKQPVFTVDYARTEDVYALKSEEIVTKYVGVENNNLKQLFNKLGVQDTSMLPDKIEPKSVQGILAQLLEHKERIASRYITIIDTNIPEEKYQSEKKVAIEHNDQTLTGNKHQLQMTQQELVNLVSNLLQSLKTDEETLQILLGNDTNTINSAKENIQQAMDELANTNPGDSLVTLAVYEVEGKVIKVEIKSDDTIISIETKQSEEKMDIIVHTTMKGNAQSSNVLTGETTSSNATTTDSYTMTLYKKEMKLQIATSLSMQRGTVLNNANEVEKISIEIATQDLGQGKYQDRISIASSSGTITYTDNKIFTNAIEIEELNSENSIIINHYSSEEISGLLAGIVMRANQVITEKISLTNSGIDVQTQPENV